jgi:hypothetical protein
MKYRSGKSSITSCLSPFSGFNHSATLSRTDTSSAKLRWGSTLQLIIMFRSDMSQPKSAIPALPGTISKELRRAGETCHLVSLARIFILCDDIPL